MERSTAGSATNLRVPHPSRSLRRVGSKNLDTNVRLSHPLQRTQRMGHPEIHGPSCLPKHEARLVSSQKAAHVDVGWVRAAGDPGFARDDKGRVALPLIVVTWDGRSDSTDVHSSVNLPTGKSATRDDKGGEWGFHSRSVARIPGLKGETWGTLRFVPSILLLGE
jgi:hypothetical protein